MSIGNERPLPKPEIICVMINSHIECVNGIDKVNIPVIINPTIIILFSLTLALYK